MNVTFEPAAENELNDAIDYLNGESPGLGLELSIEVEKTVQRIADSPETWPVVEVGARRALLKRFPFGVIYDYRSGQVHILAVMHLRRRPGYWIDRR